MVTVSVDGVQEITRQMPAPEKPSANDGARIVHPTQVQFMGKTK